jgi:prolyl-tRNA synthetase
MERKIKETFTLLKERRERTLTFHQHGGLTQNLEKKEKIISHKNEQEKNKNKHIPK